MNASMRELLRRQEIDREVISLRNSLLNHVDGLAIGLRDAQLRFSRPADGDGYARGCHRPSQAVAGDLAYVVPAWVPVIDATRARLRASSPRARSPIPTFRSALGTPITTGIFSYAPIPNTPSCKAGEQHPRPRQRHRMRVGHRLLAQLGLAPGREPDLDGRPLDLRLRTPGEQWAQD